MSSNKTHSRRIHGASFLPYSIPEEKVRFSVYPLFAGMILLISLTIWAGMNYLDILSDFWRFVSSFGSVLPWQGTSGILKIGLIVAVLIVVDLVCMMPLLPIVTIIAGPTKHPHKVEEALKRIGQSTSGWFLFVLFEELFARLLFMGFLAMFLPGGMFLWGVVGNILWALLHFINYHQEDRQLIRVLPQFIGGFFLIAVYAHFGFFWTVVAHFSYNAMLFAMAKRKDGPKENILYALYWGVVVLIGGYFFFQNPYVFEIMKGWLAGDFAPTAQAGFWDYFLAVVFVGSISEFALSVIGYDVRGITKKEITGILDLFLGAALGIGLIFLGVIIAGWFGASYLAAVLSITLFFTVLARTDTMSALSRVWFDGLVSNFVLVSAVITLGFWPSMLLFLVWYPVGLIPMVIKRRAGKFSYGNGNGEVKKAGGNTNNQTIGRK